MLDLDEMVEALGSLSDLNENYPIPEVKSILETPENSHLLQYIVRDPFGAHLFPGNLENYPIHKFLDDLNLQLAEDKAIHLWLNIPFCEYRCNYCQFPVIPFNSRSTRSLAKVREWIDKALCEAKIWLSTVPNLKIAPVGELNLFGGTPTQLPIEELERIISFFKEHFNFTLDSTIRVEGSPESLTHDKLVHLRRLGVSKLSFGVQTFNDEILKLSGRGHTSKDSLDAIRSMKKVGFKSISGDLIYGLLGQTVESFEEDVNRMIELNLDTIVITKLHLRSFKDTRTSIAGTKPALWESPEYREFMKANGLRWPSLGEIYQMRELAVRSLEKAGYYEHPTMYFNKRNQEPQKWKSLVVDQDKQHVEIGMGLGASSCCRNSEANNTENLAAYMEQIEKGQIPIGQCSGFNQHGTMAKSIRMALSTCQPLYNDPHMDRFPGESLFSPLWEPRFQSLHNRKLGRLDKENGRFELTQEGRTLVEAIINTELN